MAFTPQRDFDVGWAFSTKKQTNYATLLADVDLDRRTYFNAIEFGNISSKPGNVGAPLDVLGRAPVQRGAAGCHASVVGTAPAAPVLGLERQTCDEENDDCCELGTAHSYLRGFSG